jgi:hypothetical protein
LDALKAAPAKGIKEVDDILSIEFTYRTPKNQPGLYERDLESFEAEISNPTLDELQQAVNDAADDAAKKVAEEKLKKAKDGAEAKYSKFQNEV